MWERREAVRRDRERAAKWRGLLEQARRDRGGKVRAAPAQGALPGYVTDRSALGPAATGALRPEPRTGRVAAAGIDTMSPCWYAEPGSPPAAAMNGLARQRLRFARLLPDPVRGCRVGWFPDSGLIFAEGRLGEGSLLSAGSAQAVTEALESDLADLGIGVGSGCRAGLRRLDVAVDLWMDSSAEGLGLLECLAGASLGSGKVCAYRAQRCVESVLVKSRAGRTLARVYDKGVQGGAAPRGRLLRLEAQWRFARGTRLELGALDAELLRERFKRRFEPVWQAAGGLALGGLDAVTERIGRAVESGQLRPSRARSVAGYLVLRSAGVGQGASRTAYELERECRELGLSVSLLRRREARADVASVIDECLVPSAWC